MKKDLYIEFLQEYYQKNGTINDIPNGYQVIYQGKRLDVYNFLSRIRIDHDNFLRNNNKRRGIDSPLALERYKKLEEMNFSWEIKKGHKTTNFDTDIYIRFLQSYYSGHKTINDITSTTEVEFEGQLLKIGSYLDKMRSRYLKYGHIELVSKIKSRKVIAQYKALIEMDIAWNKEKDVEVEQQLNLPFSDIYIRFLRQYYEENGTINDLGGKYIVEFEEEKLNISQFLRNMRTMYNHYKRGSTTKRGVSSELALYRYKALQEMNFDFENQIDKKSKGVNKEPMIRYLRKYYKKHGTINNISQDYTVIFEDEVLKVGDFLTSIRANHKKYLTDKDDKKAGSKLFLARYKALESLGIDWSTRFEQKRKNVSNEPEILYLQEHFKKNGTINDIAATDIVFYKGQRLKIGAYISKIKSNHNKYLEGEKGIRYAGELALARYEILEELQIKWTGRKNSKIEKINEEPIIRYLREHYKLFGTINNIKSGDIVYFEGERLPIGDHLATIRVKYNKYISSDKKEYCSDLYQAKYKILEELGIIWKLRQKKSNKESATKNDSFMTKYYELTKRFNGNPRKAFALTALNEKMTQEKEYTIAEILERFIITEEEFIKLIDQSTLKRKKSDQEITLTSEMTLKDFCEENGYKLDILQAAVTLKMKDLCDEDLTSLINRSLFAARKYNQGITPNWIYLKYGNEYQLSNMLSFIGLDKNKTLATMKDNLLTLPEIIEDECFRQTVSKEDYYLEGVYKLHTRYYEEVTTNPNLSQREKDFELWKFEVDLDDEYPLTGHELRLVMDAFREYKRKSYKYKLFDVAFEKDNETKVRKIITYNLDDDDIEEAFFLPLKFDQKVLIGRDSELYKRRALLRNITLSWNDLKEEEKLQRITQHALTAEEQYYIQTTRQTIDTIKEKVHQKK